MGITLHLLYDEEVFRQNVTGRYSDFRIVLLVAPSPHREYESGEFTAKTQRAQRKRTEGEKPGKCEVEKRTFTTSLLLILLFFSAIFAFSAVSEPFPKIGSATFVTNYSGGTVPFTPHFRHKELRIHYCQKLVGVGIPFSSQWVHWDTCNN